MSLAIYVRVSTQRQAQTQTIEQQLERLRAHIVSQGWELAEENIFRDDGYSGASLNRPGLDRLRDQVRACEIDRVLRRRRGGRCLIAAYYWVAPGICRMLEQGSWAHSVLRIALWPVFWAVARWLKAAEARRAP